MRTLVLILMLGCSLASAKEVSGPKVLLVAREAVKDRLKDPDSAKFKSEKINGTTVCGEVNSKNSYGGYIGFKRYIVRNDGGVTFDGEYPELFQGWWEGNC